MRFVSDKMKKLFGIPKPKALPSKMFGSKPGEYTWEDWREDAKKDNPIRYFFSETVPHWWNVHISMNIEHAWYWLRTHTVHRYHKLDLRQPYTGTDDDYTWGWLDEDRQLVFACFNVLVSYVDSVNSQEHIYGTDNINDLRESMIKDGVENPDDMPQLKCLMEAKELYQYWTVKRKVDLNKRRDLLLDWSRNKDKDGNQKRWNALRKAEDDFDKEEEEMLIRLIKIRRSLWT